MCATAPPKAALASARQSSSSPACAPPAETAAPSSAAFPLKLDCATAVAEALPSSRRAPPRPAAAFSRNRHRSKLAETLLPRSATPPSCPAAFPAKEQSAARTATGADPGAEMTPPRGAEFPSKWPRSSRSVREGTAPCPSVATNSAPPWEVAERYASSGLKTPRPFSGETSTALRRKVTLRKEAEPPNVEAIANPAAKENGPLERLGNKADETTREIIAKARQARL